MLKAANLPWRVLGCLGVTTSPSQSEFRGWLNSISLSVLTSSLARQGYGHFLCPCLHVTLFWPCWCWIWNTFAARWSQIGYGPNHLESARLPSLNLCEDREYWLGWVSGFVQTLGALDPCFSYTKFMYHSCPLLVCVWLLMGHQEALPTTVSQHKLVWFGHVAIMTF